MKGKHDRDCGNGLYELRSAHDAALLARLCDYGFLNLGVGGKSQRKMAGTRRVLSTTISEPAGGPSIRCRLIIDVSLLSKLESTGEYKNSTVLTFIPHRLFFLDHHYRHLCG